MKDLVQVNGVRENQIIGYGLVVGLAGSGDKQGATFTVQSLGSLLSRIGVGVDPETIQVKNVAAVMVTALLPPFARAGSQLDVVVSSVGDATSLLGGTLLVTPMYGTDGEVYGIAQGPLSVGGFSAGGDGGSSVQKNHTTVARIAGGATVEREVAYSLEGKSEFRLALNDPDFTTARRAADAINLSFGPGVAWALDSGTIGLKAPETFQSRTVAFFAKLEQLEVQPDSAARVILNERTGTVVMGADVRIRQVAVAHGNLAVTISVTNDVSQPNAFSETGTTEPVQNTDVEATEQGGEVVLIEESVTINDLVRGLNAIGVTPRDLIIILQSIRAAGALPAQLELI